MSPSHSVADTCTDPGMVISSKYTREYGSGSPTSALVKCLMEEGASLAALE